VIVTDGLSYALLPSLRHTDLARLSALALHQLQRLVKFAAGAAAVGFAALAQALGQGAAEKPAIECEASKLGAKVSLGSGELGTMEVIAHTGSVRGHILTLGCAFFAFLNSETTGIEEIHQERSGGW
jgi:hypothetical protein